MSIHPIEGQITVNYKPIIRVPIENLIAQFEANITQSQKNDQQSVLERAKPPLKSRLIEVLADKQTNSSNIYCSDYIENPEDDYLVSEEKILDVSYGKVEEEITEDKKKKAEEAECDGLNNIFGGTANAGSTKIEEELELELENLDLFMSYRTEAIQSSESVSSPDEEVRLVIKKDDFIQEKVILKDITKVINRELIAPSNNSLKFDTNFEEIEIFDLSSMNEEEDLIIDQNNLKDFTKDFYTTKITKDNKDLNELNGMFGGKIKETTKITKDNKDLNELNDMFGGKIKETTKITKDNKDLNELNDMFGGKIKETTKITKDNKDLKGLNDIFGGEIKETRRILAEDEFINTEVTRVKNPEDSALSEKKEGSPVPSSDEGEVIEITISEDTF